MPRARRQLDAHVQNHLAAIALAAKIAEQVRAGAGKGLNTFRVFLIARVKEELSVAAPRRRARARDRTIYYVATTRAIPGAPPRKLSGRLRASVTSRMVSKTRAVIGTNVKYGKYLELGRRHPHKFFEPIARRHAADGAVMIGRAVKVEIRDDGQWRHIPGGGA